MYFDPAPEQAICLTGGEFQVNVRPGASDEVLLYLQGGGACWDHDTCYVSQRALMRANGAIAGGVVDLDDERNPFHGWDVVYVPYCDGSLFAGDATVAYDGVRTFHHGLWNLSAGIDVLAREFPNASRIVVAGSSAGGYGTIPGYAAARVAFPDTPIVVFNDSGPGLDNADGIADVATRAERWQHLRRLPASCAECASQTAFFIDWALERDAMLRVALYSFQDDAIVADFFRIADYRALLLGVSDELRRRHPERFQRYLPAGSDHTMLLFQQFYTQTVDGVALRDWTQAFLDDGTAWTDVVE